MGTTVVIDVTKIEPRLKHPSIFDAFDALNEGGAILIHNDHDPKPLYYQLLAERGNIFTWSYVENGPIVWEVEIRKNEASKGLETVGEIAAKDMHKAGFFKKIGIDFCCGGKKTLEEACLEKGIDVLQVKEDIAALSHAAPSAPQHDFNAWNLSFLSDYIVNVHHAYVKQNLPVLLDLSQKVADHHHKTNPEVELIKDVVDKMSNELKVHLNKEEHILFPYIKQMENSKMTGGNFRGGFSSVQQPIAVMENDHDVVGDLANEIRVLTNGYTVPENACNSYSLLYKKLEEFEDDLHMHIHLENNILFPRALKLENEM